MELAKDIAKGCRKMYETKTGLGPEIVYFNTDPANVHDISIKVVNFNQRAFLIVIFRSGINCENL